MKDIVKFLNEVKLELSRVIWPKYDEWVGATVVVIFLTAFFVLYFFVVDSLLQTGITKVIGYFAG